MLIYAGKKKYFKWLPVLRFCGRSILRPLQAPEISSVGNTLRRRCTESKHDQLHEQRIMCWNHHLLNRKRQANDRTRRSTSLWVYASPIVSVETAQLHPRDCAVPTGRRLPSLAGLGSKVKECHYLYFYAGGLLESATGSFTLAVA